ACRVRSGLARPIPSRSLRCGVRQGTLNCAPLTAVLAAAAEQTSKAQLCLFRLRNQFSKSGGATAGTCRVIVSSPMGPLHPVHFSSRHFHFHTTSLPLVSASWEAERPPFICPNS